jgi:hypothetical protein
VNVRNIRSERLFSSVWNTRMSEADTAAGEASRAARFVLRTVAEMPLSITTAQRLSANGA